MAVCEQWAGACEYLTGQVWKRYSPHPWKGDKHRPQGLSCLAHRLEEVGDTCQSLCGFFGGISRNVQLDKEESYVCLYI